MKKIKGLVWEEIDYEMDRPTYYYRASVIGGWLVRATWREGIAMTFVPDHHHAWVV